MPIAVKDYTWKESDVDLTITIPLKGVKGSKADIFSTNQYIKVNYPPYLFEVHLFALVVEEKCTAKVGNGVIEFVLIKEEPGIWGRLNSEESREKDFMTEKRAEAIEHAQKAAAELAEQKAKKKRDEDTYAIRQQMKLEEEERERIEQVKQEERDRAEKDLETWKEEKKPKQKSPTPHVPLNKKRNNITPNTSIWKEKKTNIPPPPRKAGSIQVRFTPRVFPTAARESKAQEEEEWLAKQAAARRIASADKTSSNGDINERNPEFLKDKGGEFFRTGNYEAAVNAFSEAIKLNPNLPQLFSNRAACYLAKGDNDKCINDCTRALELFYPVVPSNYVSRSKVFVRRGTAFANAEELGLALQDYEAALKLAPEDASLMEDCAKLKIAYENRT